MVSLTCLQMLGEVFVDGSIFLEECKMRICRILTNNALVVLDEKGKEQIVCGKGCCML